MKLNNSKKKKSNPHCFDFMLNEQSTFKTMTVREKSHCGVGIYISIDPHYVLIQSGSQVDLGGDVEGLVRCYQSSQLNHPLNYNHPSFRSYFLTHFSHRQWRERQVGPCRPRWGERNGCFSSCSSPICRVRENGRLTAPCTLTLIFTILLEKPDDSDNEELPRTF